MASLLTGTVTTTYTPNFSDMLFMVIKMQSPRGFPDFILGAKKYAKNSLKIVIFFTQFFANISGSNQKFRNRLGDVLFFPTGSPFKTF